MLRQCVICKDVIWHTEHGLCFAHRRFAELWSAVAAGARSDWRSNLVSHKEMALTPAARAIIPWQVVIGDINRQARYVLDGDDEIAA